MHISVDIMYIYVYIMCMYVYLCIYYGVFMHNYVYNMCIYVYLCMIWSEKSLVECEWFVGRSGTFILHLGSLRERYVTVMEETWFVMANNKRHLVYATTAATTHNGVRALYLCTHATYRPSVLAHFQSPFKNMPAL